MSHHLSTLDPRVFFPRPATRGAVCSPSFVPATHAGETRQVMCLDFHPLHNSLLAVGCHDGTVMVFDVRHKANRPIYSSSIKTGKHTDPVWQVRGRARGCFVVRVSPFAGGV